MAIIWAIPVLVDGPQLGAQTHWRDRISRRLQHDRNRDLLSEGPR